MTLLKNETFKNDQEYNMCLPLFSVEFTGYSYTGCDNTLHTDGEKLYINNLNGDQDQYSQRLYTI